MDYRDIMSILSACETGAALLSEESCILAVNEAGDRLLHGGGALEGKLLSDIALELCGETEQKVYAQVAFDEYLVRCPAPEAEGLPEGTRLIAFRDATGDCYRDILMHVVNQLSEAVFICDAQTRVMLLNNAAVQMEQMDSGDVRGQRNEDVYRMLDGSKNHVPEVIRTRTAQLNQRQYYVTRFGKEVDMVSNNFPIVQNGQVLGGFSVMEDWSTIDHLHRQILELQEKLRARTGERAGRSSGKAAGSGLSAKYHFDDIVHVSQPMHSVVERCRQVARSDSSVMIYGETGTGKELVAQSIHNASRRASGPFLAINCAAIPENLLESLLFGTEKGAYTGADRRAGLFEQADGGTLLLDEINSMNLNLQAKLLRVLQDGTVRRVGGSGEISVDVRVLSNTNIMPYEAVDLGQIRRDLFYRLGVVNISIPPLRARKEDIPLLVRTFIMQYNQKLLRNVQGASKETLQKLNAYDWPGNVRELQHAVEHAMNIMPDDLSVIEPEYLPEHIGGPAVSMTSYRTYEESSFQERPAGGSKPGEQPNMYEEAIRGRGVINRSSAGSDSSGSGREGDRRILSMDEIERETLRHVLRETGGNISAAARRLGMSRQKLQYRIRRSGLDPEEFR